MWFNKDISYWIEIHTDWMEIYFDVRCHVIFYFCNHCRGKDIKIFFFNFNYLRQLRRFFDISVLQQNWWHIHITNDINSFVALANVKEILSLKSAAILGLMSDITRGPGCCCSRLYIVVVVAGCLLMRYRIKVGHLEWIIKIA